MSSYCHFQREELSITSLFSTVNSGESGRSRGINTGRAGTDQADGGRGFRTASLQVPLVKEAMGRLFRSRPREAKILHSLCQNVSAAISSSEALKDIKPLAGDEGRRSSCHVLSITANHKMAL